DVGGLFVIHPEAAHGVMHAGENLHRRYARIVADKFLVDFQNSFELAIKSRAIDVSQVEINHGLAVDTKLVLVDNFMNRARGHVTRNQVAVLGIPLFEKIKALGSGDLERIALIAFVLRNPDAAAFTTRRLRHEAQLVVAGNGSRVDLNELTIRVIAALLIQ